MNGTRTALLFLAITIALCVCCGAGAAAFALLQRPIASTTPMPTGTSGPVDTSSGADLRYGIERWQLAHGLGVCPTVDQLAAEGLLYPTARADDFGGAWVITCSGASVVGTGPGPDHVPGTPDDIVVRVN